MLWLIGLSGFLLSNRGGNVEKHWSDAPGPIVSGEYYSTMLIQWHHFWDCIRSDDVELRTMLICMSPPLNLLLVVSGWLTTLIKCLLGSRQGHLWSSFSFLPVLVDQQSEAPVWGGGQSFYFSVCCSLPPLTTVAPAWAWSGCLLIPNVIWYLFVLYKRRSIYMFGVLCSYLQI